MITFGMTCLLSVPVSPNNCPFCAATVAGVSAFLKWSRDEIVANSGFDLDLHLHPCVDSGRLRCVTRSNRWRIFSRREWLKLASLEGNRDRAIHGLYPAKAPV